MDGPAIFDYIILYFFAYDTINNTDILSTIQCAHFRVTYVVYCVSNLIAIAETTTTSGKRQGKTKAQQERGKKGPFGLKLNTKIEWWSNLLNWSLIVTSFGQPYINIM